MARLNVRLHAECEAEIGCCPTPLTNFDHVCGLHTEYEAVVGITQLTKCKPTELSKLTIYIYTYTLLFKFAF